MDINDVFPDFWDWRNFIIAAKAQGKLKSWSRPSTFDTSGTGYEAAGDGVVEYAGKRWCISIKNGGKSPYRHESDSICIEPA